jgi:hypothetical protein
MAEPVEKEQVVYQVTDPVEKEQTVYTFDEIKYHIREISDKKFTFNGILVGSPRGYSERAGTKSYEFVNYDNEDTYWIQDVVTKFRIRTRDTQSGDTYFEKDGSYDNTFIMV